jgi:hypothetical protein
MHFSRSNHSAGGFSNQQALLLLLIAVPISLIGISLVITVAVRPRLPQTAQAAAPANESTRPTEPTTIVEQPTQDEAQDTAAKPLANRAREASNSNNCWFQMESDGQLIGRRCSVSQRSNANGDRVFDVVEPSGLKRSVVLWDNEEAEVFLQGQRYTGNWHIDEDGDVRVSLPGGTFAFMPPA